MTNNPQPNPNCTELIWVTPALAKEYHAVGSPERAEAVIKAATLKLGAEVQTALLSLDDDILKFKARGLAYREAYEAAFVSEADSAYAIWEAHEDRLSALRKDADQRLRSIRDLTLEVQDANEHLFRTLQDIKTYQVEYLADQLERIIKLTRQLTPQTIAALQLIGAPNDQPETDSQRTS